ncbi:hypothetical protein CWE09_13875 [Aliidiomarina minuta]|uniref:Uncharacterized protein n=1 Tax=Aliidiomarina minuta TaxID=880057 RepID=A0A432W1H9_9GAMM|nr:hypothetical protein CWE09_13875 [Aliidiomarina minuta]
MRPFLRVLFSFSILRRAALVSLVVGSLLNLINQSDSIFQQAPIDWINLYLNFLVPFCVSSFSAAAQNFGDQSAQEPE